MTRGLLDHIEQASHIVAGTGVGFDEALEIVKAAHREQEYRDADAEIENNVIYGVDFGRR
ncbi:hypothetical protein H8B02_11740 [Bradyrhizobium sp. Pear77]|uniref:hypothetical protein n=1 Tax=Bradyrhizobium altum TaxID=1571202 RepID=UPI001E4FDFFE|nr:hypothetical protein [Bradyrhizobium altum]MCC8954108.1 hypothetical protein [Bradyrhizobium altum]